MRGWLTGARSLWNQLSGAPDDTWTEEERVLGVTPALVAAVAELVRHPLTFVELPVEQLCAEGAATMGGLSDAQRRHATLAEARCAGLAQLRRRLVPHAMTEEAFWLVYFLLVRRHVVLPEGPARPPARVASGPDWAAALVRQDAGELTALALAHPLPGDTVRGALYRVLLPPAPDAAERCAAAYAVAFGTHVPEHVVFPPRVNAHARSEDVLTDSAGLRALACLALEACAAPQTPALLALLLRLGYSEAEAYCVAKQAAAEGPLELHARTRAARVDELLTAAVPDVAAHLAALRVAPAALVRPSLHTLFGAAEGALDALLLGGGWEVLQWWAAALALLVQPQLVHAEAADALPTWQTCEKRHARHLAALARGLRADVRWAPDTSVPGTPEVAAEAGQLGTFTWMRVRAPSQVLGTGAVGWQLLHHWFPQRFRVAHALALRYSSLQDGISLRTLYARARAATDAPCVLLVSTVARDVFGAYLSAPPFPRPEGGGYGSGECFLFQLAVAGVPHAQRYAARDSACIVTTATELVVGDNALALDAELRAGVSRPARAFALPHPLNTRDGDAGDGCFQCVHCELWQVEPD